MEKVVKSPFTGSPAHLQQEVVALPFKGGKHNVIRCFYECKESGERFTSPEQHDAVMKQLRTAHQKKTSNEIFHAAIVLDSNVVSFIKNAHNESLPSAYNSDEQQAVDSFSHWSKSRNSTLQTAD